MSNDYPAIVFMKSGAQVSALEVALGSGAVTVLPKEATGYFEVRNAPIRTGNPAGGTAAKWKLGTVAAVSPTSPNRTIEVDVEGTTYYLAAKTTNN